MSRDKQLERAQEKQKITKKIASKRKKRIKNTNTTMNTRKR